MKRLILTLAVVLVMTLAIAAPVFAQSQTWYLYNATMSDNFTPSHTEIYMSRTRGQTGQVDFLPNDTKLWIANKIATTQVTYPNDLWEVCLATDADWGNNGSLCTANVGYWDGNAFTKLDTSIQDINYFFLNFVVVLRLVPVGGQTIPANTYLALQVHNGDGVMHPVYTGKQLTINGDWYYSCLISPSSDPGYPLPELAAGILLGAGILGLGGFIILRRMFV